MKLDMESEFIKEFVEKGKKEVEKSILSNFECKVEALNTGEVKDGKFELIVCYICQDEIPKGEYIVARYEIDEKDLMAWKVVDAK